MLTACGASTGLSSSARLDLSKAPSEPVKDCKDVSVLPEKDLTKAQVEALWEIDRVHLAACYGNVEALLAYIDKLKTEAAKAPITKVKS